MKKRPVVPMDSDPASAVVQLTKGIRALVSFGDADLVGRYNWYACKCDGKWYAARSDTSSGVHRTVLLHRFLGESYGFDMGLEVDHIDGDGLNCRRSNLREASSSQNKCNTGLTSQNTSGVKGVSWYKAARAWRADIKIGGRQLYLGRFGTREDAHAAVTAERLRLHGVFANAGGG